MKFLDWNDDHLTGIESIDEQHNEIADKINELYKLVGTKERSHIIELLRSLNKLMDQHFEHENSLMKEHKVFNLFSHKAQHDRLSKILDENLDKIEENKQELTNQYLFLLRDWTLNHFIFHDKDMANELKEKGVL